MKLYKKLYKTTGGWILLCTILPIITVLLIIALALLTLNSAISFLIFPALAVVYIGIFIPPQVVRSRLKAMPEKRERVKLLDKGQSTAYSYYSHRRRLYIRRRTLIFEFPDGSRKSFQIDLGTDDLSVVNDTGIITYKERNGETLLISFDADKKTEGGQ